MQVLLVGVGGFIGSALRYLIASQFSALVVPGGTFVVNMIGCLCMGLVTGYADVRGWPSRDTFLFVTTGVLGGFTTFSAFGQEAVTLLGSDPVKGAALTAVHVVLGVAAVALGRVLVAFLFRPA